MKIGFSSREILTRLKRHKNDVSDDRMRLSMRRNILSQKEKEE
jgi:hypothetical protein